MMMTVVKMKKGSWGHERRGSEYKGGGEEGARCLGVREDEGNWMRSHFIMTELSCAQLAILLLPLLLLLLPLLPLRSFSRPFVTRRSERFERFARVRSIRDGVEGPFY